MRHPVHVVWFERPLDYSKPNDLVDTEASEKGGQETQVGQETFDFNREEEEEQEDGEVCGEAAEDGDRHPEADY